MAWPSDWVRGPEWTGWLDHCPFKEQANVTFIQACPPFKERGMCRKRHVDIFSKTLSAAFWLQVSACFVIATPSSNGSQRKRAHAYGVAAFRRVVSILGSIQRSREDLSPCSKMYSLDLGLQQHGTLHINMVVSFLFFGAPRFEGFQHGRCIIDPILINPSLLIAGCFPQVV